MRRTDFNWYNLSDKLYIKSALDTKKNNQKGKRKEKKLFLLQRKRKELVKEERETSKSFIKKNFRIIRNHSSGEKRKYIAINLFSFSKRALESSQTAKVCLKPAFFFCHLYLYFSHPPHYFSANVFFIFLIFLFSCFLWSTLHRKQS